MLWGLLALGFAPALLWLIYFYRKDRLEPEPARLVVRCFSFGMLATVPALLLEMPFGSAAAALLAAPVVEELVKYLAVRLSVYSRPEFNEPMDGIVYAAATALGFAFLENVTYFHRALEGEGTLTAVFLLRSFLSTPGHVLWSGVWGLALGFAKMAGDGPGSAPVRRALAGAMGLHALFNLICLSFGVLGYVFGLFGLILVMIHLWRRMRWRIREAADASPFRMPPEDGSGP